MYIHVYTSSSTDILLQVQMAQLIPILDKTIPNAYTGIYLFKPSKRHSHGGAYPWE